MRYFLVLILLFSTSARAQSRRVNPTAPANPAIVQTNELTAKQMFDEANAYAKQKFAEFESRKIPFSDSLYQQTLREQKQLAAKYAAALAARQTLLAGEDFYHLGMLNFLAENADNAAEAFRKFLATEGAAAEKSQTARSVIIVAAARKKSFDEAETLLGDYLKAAPVKLSERARMEGELAVSYRAEKNFTKAAAHAEEAYRAAKAVLADAASRARALEDIETAGTTAFEIYAESGKQKEAENTLEDLRKVAASIGSSSLYFAAIDRNIKYLIATNRKPLALEMYAGANAAAERDFTAKPLREDIARRLKQREKHYKLLGETAPELVSVDRWFPGQAQTFADLRGKVVLLDFWATWCGPCISAFPALTEWHETFQRDGLKILGVTKYHGEAEGFPADNPTEIEYLQRFRKNQRLPYDFVVAKDTSNQLTYGASSIPTTVLIDRRGVIRYIETGTSRGLEEEIRTMIEKLLAEK